MKVFLIGAALVAAFHIGASAQPAAKPGQPAKAAQTAKPDPGETSGKQGLYRSPFADYRPFNADEPMKDWRRANDEVRDAGGHVGLLKGDTAQLTGHGAHGAKQPTPPSGEKK